MEGAGVGFRWAAGGENEGKREGVGRVGVGVGTGKGTDKSMCTLLSKLPFSKLPVGSARSSYSNANFATWMSMIFGADVHGLSRTKTQRFIKR